MPKQPTTITATKASERFSDVLNRCLYQGEAFIVHRQGRPVCAILPISDGDGLGQEAKPKANSPAIRPRPLTKRATDVNNS
jgi:antitoxin (DNA-binding transcriptional repressor) of toxin-antitoxin stability system